MSLDGDNRSNTALTAIAESLKTIRTAEEVQFYKAKAESASMQTLLNIISHSGVEEETKALARDKMNQYIKQLSFSSGSSHDSSMINNILTNNNNDKS